MLADRREFLRAAASAGASWAAADLCEIEQAVGWAAEQSARPAGAEPSALSRADAETIEAMAARIVPAVDGRPGAREAGVVVFIDRALATFNAGQRRVYANGIADLNRRARRLRKGATTFQSLDAADQDAVLHQIEKSRFFQAVRVDTIVGMFALPSWGGNRDHAGWRLLGLTHQPVFQPPFGYYDGEIHRGR